MKFILAQESILQVASLGGFRHTLQLVLLKLVNYNSSSITIVNLPKSTSVSAFSRRDGAELWVGLVSWVSLVTHVVYSVSVMNAIVWCIT